MPKYHLSSKGKQAQCNLLICLLPYQIHLWAKKVGGHAPKVTVNGNKIKVETDHGMSSKHYIVRHTIVTLKGEVLAEKTFSPDDEAISELFKRGILMNKKSTGQNHCSLDTSKLKEINEIENS